LSQNYPNPFNPSTTITYALSADAFVSIMVYDVLGRQVAQLVETRERQGYHQVVFGATGFVSGVYYIRMTAQPDNGQTFTEVRAMLLAK
jgi:glucuronoarabinoxylan endo-1,4-beta-xylanase